ncbi:Nucleoporin Nup43, partial [Coemansia spiralis]
MDSLQTQPVARQISSVRWLPPRAGSAYTDSELYFVSGSRGKHKELILWTTENPDFQQQQANSSNGDSALATLVAKAKHDGNVEQIAAPRPDTVATVSSYGTISIYNVDTSSGSGSLALRESVTAHRFANGEPAVATGVAVQPTAGADAEVASCGEDGRVACAPLSRLDALQQYEVDSTVVTGVCWLSPKQLAVSTRGGQVKLFDRRAMDEASAVFIDPSHAYALESIAVHPSQSFRVATGTDQGTVLLWDIRNPKQPSMEVFNVHESNVWAVQFHPTDAAKIVSCSEDASIAITQWLADSPDDGARRP